MASPSTYRDDTEENREPAPGPSWNPLVRVAFVVAVAVVAIALREQVPGLADEVEQFLQWWAAVAPGILWRPDR